MKQCATCGEPIPETLRIDAKYCSVKCGGRARNRRHYQRHPEELFQKRLRDNADLPKRMLSRAKSRAKKAGIAFNLTEEDISVPAVCPVLGTPLVENKGRRGFYQNSPSLDRIVPSRGYTKGNVRVISARANLLKSDASIEELTLVLEDLRRITS